MAKIYRTSDRIKLKIGEVTIEVAPLTFQQKTEVQIAISESAQSGDTMGVVKAAFLCVKYAVKGLSGVDTPDGKPYKLNKEDGILTDDCVNDLFSLEESESLSMVCLNLLQNRHGNFVNQNTGKKLEGVRVLEGKSSTKKPKKTVGS